MGKALWVCVGLVVVLFLVLVGLLVAWFVINPPVQDAVLVTNSDDGREGLFSRVTSWVGAGLYAEEQGASGLVLTSLDPRKMYTSTGHEDLCRKFLATSEHELRPNGLNRRRVTAARTFGFGEQLWNERRLRNMGLPARPRKDWLEMQRLFFKYARFRPEFEQAADRFWDQNIDPAQFVIGVHWRGTDRRQGNSFQVEDFLAVVSSLVLQHPGARVFIASDEAAFVERCQSLFPSFTQETARAQTGGAALHMASDRNPEANARAVILDALLLSKCHVMVKGRSCVSDYALFLNPHMGCFMLDNKTGQRYEKSPGADAYFVTT